MDHGKHYKIQTASDRIQSTGQRRTIWLRSLSLSAIRFTIGNPTDTAGRTTKAQTHGRTNHKGTKKPPNAKHRIWNPQDESRVGQGGRVCSQNH